jgi:hypothetical protein
MASLKNTFRNELPILREALEGEVQLDEEHPALFNRVVYFLQKTGCDLYGDVDDIYEEVLTLLEDRL